MAAITQRWYRFVPFTGIGLDQGQKDMEISKLAEQPLSPGEIDNVVRKIITKQVLTGQLAEFSEINDFCEEERIKKSVGGKRIGYLQ
jgi:hypothetical protein